MAFKPQKPTIDFSAIPGHQVHEVAPSKKAEPSVPASGQLDSENLKSWAYDRATQILRITFRDGGRRYAYSPVPPSMVRKLIDAESANAYFKEHIEPLLDGELDS